MSTPLVSRFARAAAIGLLMVFGAACGGSATSGPGPGDGGSLANAADASVDGSVDVAPPSDDAGGASDAGSDTGSVVGGPCDFRTCPQGCCDANGTCQMGSPTFCGTGGAACATCPSGTECLYNYHCECTPAACPSGCCAAPLGSNPAADKVCQAGTTDLACGTAGETCSDCVGQGQGGLCLGQKCAYPTPCKCANGCCDRTGQCQPGASNTQCGSSSNAYGYCVDCTPYGTQCDFQSCIAAGDAGVCNEQTCPNGCCDSNEQCQQGLTSTSCGNFGTTCQNCLPAGVCSNQKCTTPDGGRLCSATNCPDGCCDGAGRCQSGSEATLCGAHGAQCVDCTPFGDRCEAGACTAPDGATLCAQTCSGCCDPSGACQPGIADAQCGEGGGACTNCAALAAQLARAPIERSQTVQNRTANAELRVTSKLHFLRGIKLREGIHQPDDPGRDKVLNIHVLRKPFMNAPGKKTNNWKVFEQYSLLFAVERRSRYRCRRIPVACRTPASRPLV